MGTENKIDPFNAGPTDNKAARKQLEQERMAVKMGTRTNFIDRFDLEKERNKKNFNNTMMMLFGLGPNTLVSSGQGWKNTMFKTAIAVSAFDYKGFAIGVKKTLGTIFNRFRDAGTSLSAAFADVSGGEQDAAAPAYVPSPYDRLTLGL